MLITTAPRPRNNSEAIPFVGVPNGFQAADYNNDIHSTAGDDHFYQSLGYDGSGSDADTAAAVCQATRRIGGRHGSRFNSLHAAAKIGSEFLLVGGLMCRTRAKSQQQQHQQAVRGVNNKPMRKGGRLPTTTANVQPYHCSYPFPTRRSAACRVSNMVSTDVGVGRASPLHPTTPNRYGTLSLMHALPPHCQSSTTTSLLGSRCGVFAGATRIVGHGNNEEGRTTVASGYEEGQDNVNVSEADEYGWTPLHYAADGDHALCTALLLRANADACIPNHFGMTPLHLAALSGNVSVIRILLDHHFLESQLQFQQKMTTDATASFVNSFATFVNQTDSNGLTALHYAAREGNAAAVEALLHKERSCVSATNFGACLIGEGGRNVTQAANTNSADRSGRTPLHYASERGHLHIVRLLAMAGATIDKKCSEGCTPLFLAVVNGCTEVVSFFLREAGAAVNASTVSGWTPLHVAASQRGGNNRSHTIMRMLLDAKTRDGLPTQCRQDLPAVSKVNTTEPPTCCPLAIAVRSGDPTSVALLIRHGHSVNDSLFPFPSFNFSLAVLEELLDAGADADTMHELLRKKVQPLR